MLTFYATASTPSPKMQKEKIEELLLLALDSRPRADEDKSDEPELSLDTAKQLRVTLHRIARLCFQVVSPEYNMLLDSLDLYLLAKHRYQWGVHSQEYWLV